VIDPTDKDRNVAAAVSKDNFRKLALLSKRFLKKPSESFFFKKQESFEKKISRFSGTGFLISMPRPDVVDDVLWGQLHRLMKQMKCSLKDFEPKKMVADDHRHLVRIAIFLGKEKLPEKMLVAGPPLKMKENVVDFRKSHKRAKFITKKRQIFAEVKRKTTKAEKAIHLFLNDFSKTKSHLAYPEEIVIVEKIKR
jgi:tRNA nucleotidyltransferase (CCA-adding enzyme)